MIKGLIKFWMQTYIKNACDSLKWMSGMTTLQLYATIFERVLQNHLLKMSIPLLLHLRQQLLQHQTQQQLSHNTRRRKLKRRQNLCQNKLLVIQGLFFPHFRNPQIFWRTWTKFLLPSQKNSSYSISLSLLLSIIVDFCLSLYCHKLSDNNSCITVASRRRSFVFSFLLIKKILFIHH